MPLNSHYVPQLLLKGFACRTEGKESYVCVFRKGGTSFTTNTKNVAAQRDFYGNEKIESVLSSWEGQFAELVRDLRQGLSTPDDKPLVDRFVAHSLIRTKTFRDGVHVVGKTGMEKAFSEFLNPDLAPLLLHKLANDIINGPEIGDMLRGLRPEMRPYAQAEIRKRLESLNMCEALPRMIVQSLPTIDTASSVQSAQRQVLEDEKHLERRIRDLEHFIWSIEMYPPNSLVSGDIGPLTKGNDSTEWGRIFCGTPQLIWFPLSHNCLLKGQVNEIADQVNAEEVNLISVENSAEFFVASQRTTREEEYQGHLGIRSNQLSEDHLAEISATIRQYLQSPDGTLTTDT